MLRPAPPTVRQVKGGKWQVSLIESALWRTCRSEQDARAIANGLKLAAAVKCGDKTGDETAGELDEAAAAAVRNLGECWAVRMVQAAADRARSRTQPVLCR